MKHAIWMVSLCFAATAFAQDAKPPEVKSDFSLTVYSTADPASFDPRRVGYDEDQGYRVRPPGYGVVREIRKIDLKAGENDVRFTDVASGIDPTTVSFVSLTDPTQTYVVEQNYEYDLVSGEKMLDKYLDKQIAVDRKGSGAEGGRHYDGKLLSSDGTSITMVSDNGTVHVFRREEISTIQFAKQDTSLITKPTLVWKLNTQRAGQHDAQVSYQTDGITWRADYNILLNEKDTAADVSAWVTLVNQSGASYPNAKLKLIAGDVHRLPRDDDRYSQSGLFGGSGGGGGRAEEGFQEKPFLEYHLYTLGRPTTVAQNSTKQIELFPTKTDVPVEKVFVYYGLSEQFRYRVLPNPQLDNNLGEAMNKKVDVYVRMHNTEKNGMGLPLPAGRVRVSKRDAADNSLEFVGEDVIAHTPKDEELLFRIGSAFDIVGERRQTDFHHEIDADWLEETIEIKLRNHKPGAVKVIVKENLFRWVNWEIVQFSDKWEKRDYRTIHIPVDVPANGEKVVTYKVRYSW
jgi:hypothetical protein